MAPFQLRVRTLYPGTQPVPFTPLSIRLGPPPPSDVHPGEVRTQHVGSTRRPLSPELTATTPPHRTPGTQRAGLTHLPGEVHLHSLGSVFILVLGHGLMSRRTHRSPPCRNVDVKVGSIQSDRPITPVGLRWRPAPDRALERDWERMVTFHHFPREHWQHLRTTNPLESPFAALRLRTDAAKRYKRVGWTGRLQ